MKKLIESYFEFKKYAWSPSTFKSERRRLLPLSPSLDGNPERLWKELQGLAPYSRVTSWTRVCDFWSWMIEEGHKPGPNPYDKFRKQNRRLFKNAYRRKLPEISYQEAVERIQKITHPGARQTAMEILRNGLRANEAFSSSGNGVVGKGGKWRPTFAPSQGKSRDYKLTYTILYRHLRAVGLKPHDLRKLAATEFHRRGMSEVDLCYVMGWESFATAKSYVAPKRDKELREIVNAVR